MNLLRTDIINLYINKFNYKKYLEIGVQFGQNIKQIKCDLKHGVDVSKLTEHVTHHMSSDAFFKQNTETYDIIFIDGHHDSEYVCRDLNNSIKCLNKHGIIIMHDCKPHSLTYSLKLKEWERVPNDGGWCGDGFKVIKSLVKNYKDNFDVFVIDTDNGVGIVKPLTSDIEISYDDNYAWESMIQNPEKEINLISVEEFKNNINN